MGSWRWVVMTLAAAALVWGLVLGTKQPSLGPTGVRVPVADVQTDAIAVLEVTDGDRAVRIERAGPGFVIDGRPPNKSALEAMTATLGYAHSRRFRRGAGGDADLGLGAASARSLKVTLSDGRLIRFSKGALVAGDSLQWIARDGDAMLITVLESESLLPDPSALIDRRPLLSANTDPVVALALRGGGGEGFVLTGEPLRFATSGMRTDSAAVKGLLTSLAAISMTEASDGQAEPGGLVIEVTTGERSFLRIVGDCGEGRSLVETGIGRGCVAAAELSKAQQIASDPSLLYRKLIDPGVAVASAQLRVGGRTYDIDMSGEGEEAARAWLAPLLAASDSVAAVKGTRLAEVDLRLEGGDLERIEVERNAAGIYARTAEAPFGRRLTESSAAAILAFDPVLLKSRRLSARDPSEITRVVVGKQTIDGAELSGDKKARIAHLEAIRFVAPAGRRVHGLAPPRRTIRIEFSPPPIDTGDPSAIVIRLGALTDGGCYAQLARDPAVFVLPLKTCEVLATL